MVDQEQIEEYLIHAEFPYEKVGDGVWLVQDLNDAIDNIVVALTPPVITFRVKLLTINETTDLQLLYHKLLTLNATMLAGAYAIVDQDIVIVESLQSANLDYNEFTGSIEAIALSIREHFDQIKRIVSN